MRQAPGQSPQDSGITETRYEVRRHSHVFRLNPHALSRRANLSSGLSPEQIHEHCQHNAEQHHGRNGNKQPASLGLNTYIARQSAEPAQEPRSEVQYRTYCNQDDSRRYYITPHHFLLPITDGFLRYLSAASCRIRWALAAASSGPVDQAPREAAVKVEPVRGAICIQDWGGRNGNPPPTPSADYHAQVFRRRPLSSWRDA